MHLDSKLRAVSEIADTLQGNLEKVVQPQARGCHRQEQLLRSREVRVNTGWSTSMPWSASTSPITVPGREAGLHHHPRAIIDPPLVHDVFPQDITQALLNLISNSFYAATKRKAAGNGDDTSRYARPPRTSATVLK